MKVSRRKKANRFLSFFKHNFGFRPPYQLLVDGTFCFSALKEQINLKEQIPKYMGDEVKLLTTPCVITEMEKLGPPVFGALCIVKQFPVHTCCHAKKPIPASKCILSMIGKMNENRYIVVTQDDSLREAARAIPGVPIMYLQNKAPTLEKPSNLSAVTAKAATNARVQLSDRELERLKTLKEKEFGPAPVIKKRKRKPKNPNPLSCLKKKKKPLPQKKKKAAPPAEKKEAPSEAVLS